MVSAASIWEIRIKEGIGKIKLPTDFESIVEDAPFEHLSITSRHAHAVSELPLHHRDPFDRLLIAQARCENLQLLTHDRNLVVYDVKVAF
jgi:PIN domain nuclease of toxin-antitoxin system